MTRRYPTQSLLAAALAGSFTLAYDWQTGTFQGPQYAIFAYGRAASPGVVDANWFRFGRSP